MIHAHHGHVENTVRRGMTGSTEGLRTGGRASEESEYLLRKAKVIMKWNKEA